MKKQIMKRIFAAVLAAATLMTASIPAAAASVNTNGTPIYYVQRSWDAANKKVVSETKPCTDYELLHSTSSSWYTIGQENETTWYVAKGNITMNGTTLTVRGNVNIILCNDANVKILDGIEVKTGYSLSIYGQEGDNGFLYAKNNDQDAGIGCGPNSGVGDITIHGGKVEAHGGKYAAGIGSGDERQMGSHITIYGGDIQAFGGKYGAGIGSGDETSGDNGYIDIYGGNVFAKGGDEGAGIGGGNEGNGRHITIWGGKIEAIGSSKEAAGIGGGDDGGGGYITINGGEVTAWAFSYGPAIGGDTNCGTITINGGEIYAFGGLGAGIGGAYVENLVKGSITINGGKVYASSTNSTGIGAGAGTSSGGDCDIPITINGGNVTAYGTGGSAGIGAGNAGNLNGQITIAGGYVEASANKGGGAGIGSGAEDSGVFKIGGEVTKKIKITGGTVIASASPKGNAQAIGRGCNGDSAGTELYANAKVTAGSNAGNATVKKDDERLSGLTQYYAKIEPR
ncbi:MAG: hypothetical protein IKI58_10695 [Oscillospiraceae bacterium]|nr:hypothetical protein [Oscillospiraceae bacterium]